LSTIIPQSSGTSPFDAIRQDDERGEHWTARSLMRLLGYTKWERFESSIDRARAAIENSGQSADAHASRLREAFARTERSNYRLTRYGAYMVAMNGDPRKAEVAAAQTYFAVKAREAEIAQSTPVEPQPEPKAITAAAGPLPYKEQAEILAILSPVLPAPYVTATGKIILARSMGERPELDPGETPLYAATFLAGKGLSRKAVSKFESPFGLRVSNRYLKVHGRRPEKIPGPAGSRIGSVVAYTETDRPLLDAVFSDIADMVEAFEVDLAGGQLSVVGGAA